MTKFLNLAALLLLTALCASSTTAQTADDKASLTKMWNDVWVAYETGDEAKMWSFYAENACEIYPDGSSICGKQAIREGYDAFKGMLEGKPSWSMTPPTIQFIGSDVALLMSDVTSDIKLKGVGQIGGKSKFATIVHKVKGQWLIEFDSQTPLLPPPPMPEDAKK